MNNNNYQERQKRLQEIERLENNVELLAKKISILTNDRKNIFDKQEKQMREIWRNSNYNNQEVFNLYDAFTKQNRRNQII